MPDDRERRRAAIARLVTDGLIVERAGATRTTRAWQGAMARAALVLFQRNESWRDLRLPIAVALAERYGGLPNDDLADLIEVMLPIETGELDGGRREVPSVL